MTPITIQIAIQINDDLKLGCWTSVSKSKMMVTPMRRSVARMAKMVYVLLISFSPYLLT
jgi:hypothetical protein